MKRPCFLTGLPRSRTAWLANLLTTDLSMCYHDKPFDPELVIGYTGFCGSEIATQFEEIHEQFPLAPWVVVLRNSVDALHSITEVAKSLGVYTKEYADKQDTKWQQRQDILAQICVHPETLVVHYNELDDEATIVKVWKHALPELPFNVTRWTMLKDFNVQQMTKKIHERNKCR